MGCSSCKNLAKTLLLLFLTSILAFSGGCTSESSHQEGTLAGHVTIGPLCPVEPCNVSPEVRAAAYDARKILIYARDRNSLIKTVSIGADGNYSVSLPPGQYHVDINHIGIDRSPDVPAEVEISAGETVRLDISIDTGIR